MRVRRYLSFLERFARVRAAKEQLCRIEQHILNNELSDPAEWEVRRDAHRAVEVAEKCLGVEQMGLGYQVVEAGRALPFEEWQQARAKFNRPASRIGGG
jgi:hypothetical protein